MARNNQIIIIIVVFFLLLQTFVSLFKIQSVSSLRQKKDTRKRQKKRDNFRFVYSLQTQCKHHEKGDSCSESGKKKGENVCVLCDFLSHLIHSSTCLVFEGCHEQILNQIRKRESSTHNSSQHHDKLAEIITCFSVLRN